MATLSFGKDYKGDMSFILNLGTPRDPRTYSHKSVAEALSSYCSEYDWQEQGEKMTLAKSIKIDKSIREARGVAMAVERGLRNLGPNPMTN
jgi:hypothetical protein